LVLTGMMTSQGNHSQDSLISGLLWLGSLGSHLKMVDYVPELFANFWFISCLSRFIWGVLS
jgi:hypothetical protein